MGSLYFVNVIYTQNKKNYRASTGSSDNIKLKSIIRKAERGIDLTIEETKIYQDYLVKESNGNKKPKDF